MRKLNLGCGFDKREGFVNTDSFPTCNPDVLLNIEQFPWTFEANSFDFILMKHVLEHVGATFDCFKQVMQELYRVTAPGGIIEIHVPHYRHDTWWSDPTHVRAFTHLTFQMMSRKQNDEWIAKKANYTMLSYVMDVDFELVQVRQVYDPHWASKEETGEITRDQLRTFAKEQWNVLQELQILIKAIKP
jgi:predicted SAM-dependent methyltransferase